MRKLLLERILELEIEYVKMFSEVNEGDIKITCTDSEIPDMYTHNFVYYKQKDGLFEFIVDELNKKETKAKGFFRIETSFRIDSDLIEKLPVQPEVCQYDVMAIETRKYKQLNGNIDGYVKNVCRDQKVLEDGIAVDIDASQSEMGLDFATRRIHRKSHEYKDPQKTIQLFVGYDRETPVGNIEYMPYNGMVKLEDFKIIEDYQRKGFGTTMLKLLLEKAMNDGIEHAYLITESLDTAQDMYRKCGFEKVGEKTELLFFLK